MTEIEQPPQNGIDLTTEDDENSKARPADIEQDMREMERRKRVEAIMGSKLFREELERIVDTAREGGASGILQQLSDIVGLPSSRVGNVFKASNCMLPINDIRGVESMGYAKGEKILRCKLAATFRLLDLYGWTQGLGAQITARLKVDQEVFLVNPYGMLYHEITASSLNKVDMQGQVVEQGTTNFGVNKNHFILHSIVHAARPDIRCAIYIGCSPVVAVSSLKTGLLPITKDACVLGEITTHAYTGSLIETEERDKLVRNLGPNSKVMLLSNHGALCCGESIEEAFFAACHIVQACEIQLRLLPVGVDNLVLIPEESRKTIYEQARRPPEDLEKKFAAALANTEKNQTATGDKEDVNDDATVKTVTATQKAPNWRVGGAEFEALMRMLDNAGYRTGYIYRHPLVKSELPKPKNDVELPPAVSSLGYLLEEEELYRQGIWKKGDLRKGGDRCRWLNSPNVYQKVEVLETGTPDPKKITKWVAEGSPTHGTPVRIEDPLQFVPAGTNPKEFKRVQQQIKDNRRADKISAGPQSHILEGVTWDEANRIKDATVSSAGDHVVLMGAASKGIIQRGFQHNATVYKTPYAKNPFDNVTDDELNEYKRTVERKKKSIHGEYTDTDFSETEALSSVHASAGATLMKHTVAAVSQSEPEDVSEHQVMRIETQQAPVPSQPEVILSDATLDFINGERSHTSTNRKPPTGRDTEQVLQIELNQKYQDHLLIDAAGNKENIFAGNQNICRNKELIAELKNDLLFQRQKEKLVSSPTKANDGSFLRKCTKLDRKTKEPVSSKDNITRPNKNNIATFTTSKNIPMQSNQNHENIFSQTDSNTTHENNNNTASDATENNNNELIIQSNFQKLDPFPTPTTACSSNCYYEMMFTSSELPTYETARSTDYKYAFESADSDRLYSKSLFCYTPNVCDSVFESLQRPLDNDLILNIPFTIPIHMPTSATSTPRKQQPIPSDIQQSEPTTPTSPYRTLSHFGFNSPHSIPQPEHKHIPHQLTTKYVPLTKSTSYEEIFSSPRYVDLCENCFEKIVRLKPELVYMKTRLRNLVEFNGNNKVEGIEVIGCGSSETTETLPAFPAPLEPVIEESSELISSEDGSAGRLQSLEKSISNSTFIDKITRMNYSEESANVNFLNTPRTVSSNISLEGVTDEQEHEEKKANEENLSTAMHQLKLNVQPRDELSQCGSITEIWEFGNWQDQQPLITEADDVDAEFTLTTKHNSDCPNESRRSKRRRFMSREERNQRKHEFQELWEDHITFFNNKDETLSDTESAIDETSGNAIRVQVEQMEESREVFHGRSMVTKRLFSDPLEDEQPSNDVDTWIQLKNFEDMESVDDCRFKYSLHDDECREQNDELANSSDTCQRTNLIYNEEDNEINDEEVSESCHDIHTRRTHFNSVAEDDVAELNNEELAESSDGCTSTRTFNVHNSKEQLIFRDDAADNCNGDGFNMDDIENKSPFESVDHADLKYSPRAEKFVLYEENPDDCSILACAKNTDPLGCSDDKTSALKEITELNDNESKEFNSLERIILEKIEVNQLKQSEEIFDKIETTIRNKLTPSKIEELLQRQKKLFKDGLASTSNFQFSSSTPSKLARAKHGTEDRSFSSLNLSRIFEEDDLNQAAPEDDDSPSAPLALSCSLNCQKHASNHQNHLSLPNPIDKFQTFQDLTKAYQSDIVRFRRSRSLTLYNKKPLAKKTPSPTSPNQICATVAEPKPIRSSPEIRTKLGKPSPAYKRNFVLENIRNAAIPRNVKRLQRSNASAIFLKNPFGATASAAPTDISKQPAQSTTESDGLATDVYAFQTKLVRGSPRLWVSMSQTPTKKLHKTNNFQIRRKKHQSKLPESSSSISTGTLSDLEMPSTSTSYTRTKIDVDLAALALEIEDVKPHLERYKRKLDDYGDHVAKCARNMEECIEVQLGIQEEHKKLCDDILLNQYIEEISCKVQTFSISETED